MDRSLRVAVLSDIHAHSSTALEQGDPPPSYIDIAAIPDNDGPFDELEKLIERTALQVDVLVCGGDMGDKADPQATRFAWEKVQRIQAMLGASILLGATGNHDMDSRQINGFDAKATLQQLPEYPFPDELMNNEYWANHVVVQQHENFRSVLLNSAAFHGYTDEWRHGRVSARTRAYLQQRLRATEDPGINLLVTHHQLSKYGSVDLGDVSEMQEGTALLELLGSGEHGSWFVIHGHRHWPALSQASGGRSAPIVFSAGSFSAVLYPEIQNKARNQFYVLEFANCSPGFPLKGRINAWDYAAGVGFQPARLGSGLTHRSGFGANLNPAELAAEVGAAMTDTPFREWKDLVAQVPDADYMMPVDFERLVELLDSNHQLSVLFDQDGVPSQIGRKS